MRILFAAGNLPVPPTSGGAQRTALLLRSLRELGDVDSVFVLPEKPGRETMAELQKECAVKLIFSTREILAERPGAVWGRWVRGSIGRDLQAFADASRFRWQAHAPSVARLGDVSGYDLIVARFLQVAATLDLFGRGPLVLDVDDYDPDRLKLRLRQSGWLKNLTLQRSLRYSQTAHNFYLPRAAHCWVAQAGDRRHPGLAGATVLPNIPFVEAGGSGAEAAEVDLKSKTFLMVGTMSYSANSEGVDAFLAQAWPKVIAAFPEAEFHIAGSGLTANQTRRWGRTRGVKVKGFVRDLRETYGKSLASVAPIRAGGGTNIKVLEAASFGRPCILTRVAHRGFEDLLRPGESCLRGEEVADLAEHCLALLRNPGMARAMGRQAREVVRRHFNYPVFKTAVHDGFRHALEQHALAKV